MVVSVGQVVVATIVRHCGNRTPACWCLRRSRCCCCCVCDAGAERSCEEGTPRHHRLSSRPGCHPHAANKVSRRCNFQGLTIDMNFSIGRSFVRCQDIVLNRGRHVYHCVDFVSSPRPTTPPSLSELHLPPPSPSYCNILPQRHLNHCRGDDHSDLDSIDHSHTLSAIGNMAP
jgi:hypothetical protein